MSVAPSPAALATNHLATTAALPEPETSHRRDGVEDDQRASTDTLTQIALDDLVSSFGCERRPLMTSAMRRIFARPAGAFARQMVEFDSCVGQLGLPEAARRAQRHYVRQVRVLQEDPLPDGPLLVLSNHPGMTDALSLFSALNREDLKIIALDRPFLTSLPHTRQRLFFVREHDSRSRAHLIRDVSTHLRKGGAALTFPAGHIEPDPDVTDGAIESLSSWTESVGLFLRMAPHTAIVPVLVSGVLWRLAATQFMRLLERSREDRERLAATLQLLAHVVCRVKGVTVRVHIGHPVTARTLGTTHASTVHGAVVAEMRRLHARAAIDAGCGP